MLREVLFWTVIGFPAYGNFSGHCVKGLKLVQSEGAHAIHLTNYRKEVYIGHRRFLDNDHPYQRYRKILVVNKNGIVHQSH